MPSTFPNLTRRLGLPAMAIAAACAFSAPIDTAEAAPMRTTAVVVADDVKVTLVVAKSDRKKARAKAAAKRKAAAKHKAAAKRRNVARHKTANARLTLEFGHGPRYKRKRNLRRHHTCSPRRALNKAQRRGVRHAHIRRINHRGVVVAGRKRGERVVIGFANHRSCPVRFVRVRGGWR